MKTPTWTTVKWINRHGEERTHKLYIKIGETIPESISYARNWWRETIAGSQGILSTDEARESKLQLVSIECE